MQGLAEPIGATTDKEEVHRHRLVGVATSEDHIIVAEWDPAIYGFLAKALGQDRIQLVEFSYQGHPIPTKKSKRCDHRRARPLRPEGSARHSRENTYPHPILQRRVKMRTLVDASAPCRLFGKLSQLAESKKIKPIFSTLFLSKETPLARISDNSDNTP